MSTKFRFASEFLADMSNSGQPFPIHPIDAIVVNQTSNGLMTCIGALTTNLIPEDISAGT